MAVGRFANKIEMLMLKSLAILVKITKWKQFRYLISILKRQECHHKRQELHKRLSYKGLQVDSKEMIKLSLFSANKAFNK